MEKNIQEVKKQEGFLVTVFTLFVILTVISFLLTSSFSSNLLFYHASNIFLAAALVWEITGQYYIGKKEENLFPKPKFITGQLYKITDKNRAFEAIYLFQTNFPRKIFVFLRKDTGSLERLCLYQQETVKPSMTRLP